MSGSKAKLRDPSDSPETEKILKDPAASHWLKQALSSALLRDPVDAINDAEVLARVLDERCRSILNSGEVAEEHS